MINTEKTLSLLKKTLALSAADQTEVLFWANDSHLTRFANNCIHQNVSEKNRSLSIRVVLGKKIGSASTNLLDPESIENTVAKALQIARNQKDNPHFRSLPPAGGKYASVDTFDAETASFTPDQRAQIARKVIEIAKRNHLIASGALSTGTIQVAVANSLGIQVCQSFTRGALKIVFQTSDGASGYAESFSARMREIESEQMAHQAAEKCAKGTHPADLPPGQYTVVLEPYAVGDMVGFLAYLGFGALAMQEGRSFMCGRLGQRITGENITIWDDGTSACGMPLPFDFEGVPKQPVTLIENGTARGVVYDSYTAGREEGKSSTGHALPAPNTFGPVPLNLFMKSGDSNLQEMIESTERGIYVTRFHYTNPLEPIKAVITGMTRDGTFLIEDGQIKNGVRNLRFTQSILEAFSRVSMISRDTKLVPGLEEELGGTVVPALKIEKFNFTGATAAV